MARGLADQIPGRTNLAGHIVTVDTLNNLKSSFFVNSTAVPAISIQAARSLFDPALPIFSALIAYLTTNTVSGVQVGHVVMVTVFQDGRSITLTAQGELSRENSGWFSFLHRFKIVKRFPRNK